MVRGCVLMLAWARGLSAAAAQGASGEASRHPLQQQHQHHQQACAGWDLAQLFPGVHAADGSVSGVTVQVGAVDGTGPGPGPGVRRQGVGTPTQLREEGAVHSGLAKRWARYRAAAAVAARVT